MHNDTERSPGESTPLSPKLFAAAGDEDVPVQKPVDVKEERNKRSFLLPALAVLVAGSMLLGNPSDSLAASSGGRVGGSKFKSSAPSKSYSPSRSGSGGGSGGGGSRSYNNYNLNINPPQYAPPIYGGGYGGYYGGGVPFFGRGVPFFGPTVYVGGGGGLLQFLLIPIILYVVLNVVGSFFRNRD